MNLKKAFYLLMVFLAGGITFANLTSLGFSNPQYDAGWHKIFFAVGFALMFGYLASKERT